MAARTRELAEANQRLTILDRSKSEFLNLISHEFRTPLNGLLGVGELILDGMPSTEENDELQEMFERSRRRILSMLDDALLLTQIDVRRRAVQIRSGLLACGAAAAPSKRTAEFAESRRVELAPRLRADLGLVLADENLLVRALHALLETAVKFSEEGETVGSLMRLFRFTEGYHRESWQDHPQRRPAEVLRSLLDRRSRHARQGPGTRPCRGIPHSFVVRRFGQRCESGSIRDPTDRIAKGELMCSEGSQSSLPLF